MNKSIRPINKLLLIDTCEDEDRTPRTIIKFKKNYTENDIEKIKKFEWDCFENFLEEIQNHYLIEHISYTHDTKIDYDYCIYY